MLFEGHGTEGCGCNEPGQVHADRWFVCDAINPGLRWAQVAPSTAVNDRRMALTKEIENLRKLNLDRNLEVEIESKKATIERECHVSCPGRKAESGWQPSCRTVNKSWTSRKIARGALQADGG